MWHDTTESTYPLSLCTWFRTKHESLVPRTAVCMYVRNFEEQDEKPNKVSYMVEYLRYNYIEQKISIYMSPTYFTANSPGSQSTLFLSVLYNICLYIYQCG